MNTKRLFPSLIVMLLMVLAGLPSCLPERKVAGTFIQSQQMISLLVTPPDVVFKYNHKGEEIEGFDSLTPEQQDSALWANSKYFQFVNDSILLENYMNSFMEEIRLLGFNVYLTSSADSFRASGKPQSYIFEIAQMQLDEYRYPLLDEDAFLDTVYYKKFNLNAVDFGCWFNLSKAGAESPRKLLLYASGTAYDTFDGRFFNDPFTGTVRYKYTIEELKSDDVYEMATYLGKKHAGYLYDFFLNQYIAKHLPEGMQAQDYYHYNRKNKGLSPADEDKLEIIDTK